MTDAAGGERFEEAAQLRDAVKTVQTLQDRQQKMAGTEFGHRDVFGLKRGPAGVVVQVFQVRSGRVVERIELGSQFGSDVDRWRVRRRGARGRAAAVLRAARGAARDSRAGRAGRARRARELAVERAGRKVRIVVPQRGEKRGLVDLATRNAALAYQTRFNQTTAAQYDALETLQAVLTLPSLPRRIECFDISTIQGSETVASMVVCEDGRMRRGDYRKFRIKGEMQNDFAAMHEVVQRRYRKLLEQGGPFPDLILIDGGKRAAVGGVSALEELGLANLVAVGIAKKEELLYTRDHDDPIALAANDPALLLVQRIRDEAHRFAVTFHRAREDDARPAIGAR